jgi:hypothetical protein
VALRVGDFELGVWDSGFDVMVLGSGFGVGGLSFTALGFGGLGFGGLGFGI